MLLLVVDRDAGHVAGQQVGGGELDPCVRALHGRRKRLGQLRLARARRVLQEHVPLGDERRQHEPDHLLLAEHRLPDVLRELRERLGEPGGLFLSESHVAMSFVS